MLAPTPERVDENVAADEFFLSGKGDPVKSTREKGFRRLRGHSLGTQ